MNARDRRRLERAAYHEAGHAVAAYLLGLPIGVVSIVPDAEAGTVGHAHRAAATPEPTELERAIVAGLGGPLAERWSGGPNVPATAQADRARVDRLAELLDSAEPPDTLAKRLRDDAYRLSLRPGAWTATHALAAVLVERRELGGEEVRRIIRDAISAEIRARREAQRS